MIRDNNPIYKSSVVIMSTGETPDLHSTFATTTTYSPVTIDYPNFTESKNSVILREVFSSVPAIWDYELKQGYRDLGETLSELTELPSDDEWGIETPVYISACYVATELMSNSFPAPRVFNHGTKSVVFNWSIGSNNLYLTISANKISALISSPERIQRRIEYSPDQLISSSHALFNTLGIALWEMPVKKLTTGTASDFQELLA